MEIHTSRPLIPEEILQLDIRPGEKLSLALVVALSNASRAGIRKDMETLTWFIRNARYAYGLLLVYGYDDGGRTEAMIRELDAAETSIDLSLLDILFQWYGAPGSWGYGNIALDEDIVLDEC